MAYEGYIRVSRVGGRAGDSFISPEIQRQQIIAWADLRGKTIAGWHEDFDQSGGKTNRPGLDAAMLRCEHGLSDGIVVAKIDRFARTLSGALELIRKLEDVGAEFVSVAEGIDSSTPAGKMMQRLMLILAEFELDRIRETWKEAQRQAVERGIHISSATPAGYTRNADRVLEVNRREAKPIQRAFEMAASGSYWREIGEMLNEAGVPGPYGDVNWIVQNVKNMISNPVYRGQARSGVFVNNDAHEAIVSASLWEQANVRRASTPPRGQAPALLSGLIRCAGCQHIMKPDSMRRVSGPHKGERMRTYRCRRDLATGTCPAPAAVAGWVIEPFVTNWLLGMAAGAEAVGVPATDELAELETALEGAIADLESYRDQRIVDALSVDMYAAGLTERSKRVDDLLAEMALVRGGGTDSSFTGLVEIWPSLDVREKQTVLRSSMDAIFVRRGREPIEERTFIVAPGELPDTVPQRGKRRPLTSFDW
jgi:DNA invertase Pin-like site-specific DNA recombinase